MNGSLTVNISRTSENKYYKIYILIIVKINAALHHISCTEVKKFKIVAAAVEKMQIGKEKS